ncbi:cGMP-dependent 3',5'-cyclic phosphodiesterase-like isoform X2 [Mytilus californianus]|uniref:cGMP-dependent 3',5'-cyclic phosphodiesterase-like isoform X2 n=1 Tax=Mytilus californianus TaxID=6549 RepID=UPI0022453896|nr:cGMP-dependent 3',5'-cyclic phosphodiesterase-like isoform X2 [Mytilus californianus]XP_052077056.1 cGMP-dependent 3',5'-cyclic phosphodiesterase-like isoform X2 [Mytilus californianus]
MVIEELLQKLEQSADVADWFTLIEDAIKVQTAKPICCVVYIAETETGQLQDVRKNPIPNQGVCWEAYKTRQTKPFKLLAQNDPITTIGKQKCTFDPKYVYCQPITDENQVVSVLAILTSSKQDFKPECLKPISEKLVGCYRRLCKCHTRSLEQNSTSSPPVQLQTSVLKEAIIQLCGELYDQDAADLQIKVLKFLEDHTKAECAFLLLVVPETHELFCQVIRGKILEEELRFPGHSSSFALALDRKLPLTLEDIPVDKRPGIEGFIGCKLQSMLCVPVSSKANDKLIALACLVNKKDKESFNNDDIHIIKECFQYTSTVLTSTLAFQNERKLKIQTQAMLQVARNLFTHLDDLTKLLREIMQEARNLTQAERCSVFLIDQEVDELVAKVFDGILANDNEVQNEIRMPITQGIAGHVATTGNLLNIKDAYAHPMFYRGIDDSTGFRTRNILCFPIKNETDNVLGVAQLCNKMNGPYFTTFDEDVASAFAVYCCISISHSLMYQKLQRSQHRNKLANELMIYHMQVASDEVQELAQSEIPPPSHWHPNFSKFNYPPREVPEDDTPLCCLSMFEDLGFISRWRIKRDTLARFILMVKKGYRNPPYHNWMHAFAVAHFCYLCIKNFKLNECMEDIELFALFVSCLCHDIDHRGTNNSYQVASKSVLAALYSSEGAVLERHHFAQTMCIVNTEGCNIYENLISKDYQHVLDLMRDIILATDLAHHLKILKNIEAMAKDKFEKSNLKHRKLLLCLIMTASDLSDQTKPWDSTKHIAALIYNEFFSQGDLEKSLGRTPPEMMDREKARIPDLQIGFLDHIALPVYRVLQDLFVEAKVVHNTVKENHRHWEKICALIKLRRGGSCEQMSYDQILALEEEANSLPEDEVKSVQQNGH